MEGIDPVLPAGENGDEDFKPYTVRRHENDGGDGRSILAVMTQPGAASTTKKIVQSSVASRKKLAGFDTVIE
jgi:hypothetical protein